MTDEQDPNAPTAPTPEVHPPQPVEPTQNLDLREEWGAGGVAASTSRGGDATQQMQASTPVMAQPPAKMPKNKLRGVVRDLNHRTNQSQQEMVTFRVERYDIAGNRLPPVPVEMRRYRGGLLTEGDEVEVTGSWSRGTLRAKRVRNLTTQADVRGWFSGWGKWVLLVVVLLLLAGAAFGILAIATHDTSAGTVNVPNVAGQDEASAYATLRDAGFTPKKSTEPSTTVDQNLVIRTEPPADFPAQKNSAVNVVFSEGSPIPGGGPVTAPEQPQPTSPPETEAPTTTTTVATVAIEDVSGQFTDEAIGVLTDQGLKPTTVNESSDTVPAGSAIRTDPEAGTSVPVDSAVTVYISSGPDTTSTT